MKHPRPSKKPGGDTLPGAAPQEDSSVPLVSDEELIARVLKGENACFESLVRKYSPRMFATARRYARKESEVEDIVQEAWFKAFQKLEGFRGDAPFEHWLMRLTVNVCYDFLRNHQRNRESTFSELSDDESTWLDTISANPAQADDQSAAAKELVWKLLEQLSPSARIIITLLEIEEKSVKEIAEITGWSVPMVKVRAFRARSEMRRALKNIAAEKFLG